MKFIQFALVVLCLGLAINVQAQKTESTKKVRIVKKMIDENGNETIEEIEGEGEEAERLIKEMDIDVEIEKKKTVKVETEKRIEIEIEEDGDGADENVFMLKMDGEDWAGFKDSDEFKKLPKEVQDKLKDLDIEGMTEEGDKEEKQIRIKKIQDGEEKVIEWEGTMGEEMPEDIKKMLEEEGIDLHKHHGKKEMRIMQLDKGHSMNRARLGVQIDGEDGKTVVGKVMDDSAAAAAGLKEGDVIQKINGLAVKGADDLVRKIRKYEVSEHIQIAYQRNGKTKTATAILKGNTETGEHKTMWMDDKGKTMEIKEDKEVIILKKEKH